MSLAMLKRITQRTTKANEELELWQEPVLSSDFHLPDITLGELDDRR
jgi:hypothetical protein